ncbi:MAG: glutaredoxin domain-containing protein, partial [Pseudomonadota bacterium]
DTGERYLSTPLFADIPEEMTADEWTLSKSTPNIRFDLAAVPPPAAAAAAAAARPEALAEVRRLVGEAPVVMFSLEWCEFCWSVRKMFAAAGIDYRTVALDAAALQKDNEGGELRAALKEITGQPTIPQIFIGGTHIGGATETFDAYNSGDLKARLDQLSLPFSAAAENAYSYLPAWLQPR